LEKEKKTRRKYTKEEKLIVLREYSSSKKSKAAFEKINIDFDKISTDKKYFSKLINKWKKELYKSANSSKIFVNFPNEQKENKVSENREDYIMQDYIEYKLEKEKRGEN